MLFDRSADVHALTDDVFTMLSAEIPFVRVPGTAELSVLDALEQALGLSRSAGRKLVQQGAVVVTGNKLATDVLTVPRDQAVRGRWFLVRKGARDMVLAELG